jgi:GT2 family glycosyltransferase
MLDVIMPVFINDQETLDLTKAAIDSIKVAPVKLIIIDNNSSIGGGQLREWSNSYIRNKENLGYAKAVNQGLKLAGELVVIANNDIRVSPNWFDVLKENNHWTVPTSIHFRMIPYDEPFSFGNEIWELGKERWCSSSFFLVPNKQLYDENYFNSCEDWDFWLRWRDRGYKTAYTNKVCYQHKDSHTQKQILERALNDQKNRDYFKSKWGEYPDILFNQTYPEQMNRDWRPFP